MDAAVAAGSHGSNAVGSLDSVRQPVLKRSRKPRRCRCLATPSLPGRNPSVFHGPTAPPPGIEPQRGTALPATGRTAAPAAPEVYHMDAQPAWLPDLQRDIRIIADTQKLMAQQMQTSGAELAMIQDGIRNLSVGQETLTRRADEQEAALQQMRREFQTLEKELNELKSAPVSRNVSPAQTPRSGYGRSDSPRFAGQRDIDEFQIVVGGWAEAKRERCESHVLPAACRCPSQGCVCAIRAQ